MVETLRILSGYWVKKSNRQSIGAKKPPDNCPEARTSQLQN
jgi:hypothetical protein